MSRIKGFLLFFLSMVFAYAILELGVRAIFPETVMFNRFHDAVEYNGFTTRRLRPNTEFTHTSLDGEFDFSINSSGFRMDDEIEFKKPDATIRVVALGDSHTQGMEVQQDETFSALLNGRTCNAETLEVINTGVSGSGTSEHLITLQYMIENYSPDVVVEAFYSNDLDNNDDAFHGVVDDTLVVETTVHPAMGGLEYLMTHNSIGLARYLSQESYAYSLFLNFAWEFGRRVYLQADEAPQTNFVELQVSSEDEMQRKIRKFNLILQEMVNSLGEDSQFLLVGIPSLAEYDLDDYLDDENKVYNVTPTFRDGETWHVEHGHRHINAAAHKLVADALFEEICP